MSKLTRKRPPPTLKNAHKPKLKLELIEPLRHFFPASVLIEPDPRQGLKITMNDGRGNENVITTRRLVRLVQENFGFWK